MFNSLLTQLEESLPPEELRPDEDQWPSITHTFTAELEPIVNKLLGTVALALPKRLRIESKLEFLVTTKPSTVVSEFRVRPESAYYAKMDRRAPRPEDPKGNDATGIEVSFVLCRGYPNGRVIRRPFVSLDFHVWGHHERSAFGELLRDHRYFIEKLVSSSPATFSTSCVFENVERARRKSTFEKLSLYYENPVDDEESFSLQSEFGREATEASVTSALLPMLAIYDAAMGYCIPRKRRDRILEYTALVAR